MPGSLAELYGALLKQEPQGILGAARFNPLMMAKALRQQEANPRPALSSLMNYPLTWQQFGDNIQANYPTDSPAAVRQAAFDAAKNAGPLMTVWQGSPHRFAPTKNNPLGEFDASKIGTGEGAQAYGYGHYLAEAPDVAKTYKDSNPMVLQAQRAKWHLDHVGGGKPTTPYPEPTGGHLYKVDLPDEHIGKMLDWDKPLSQQPEAVRKLVSDLPGEPMKHGTRFGGNATIIDDNGQWALKFDSGGTYRLTQKDIDRLGAASPDMTGAQIYQRLSNALGGDAAASARLREIGVIGNRYLDGGSRAGSQGTSNFVVFPGNEGILKILARE